MNNEDGGDPMPRGILVPQRWPALASCISHQPSLCALPADCHCHREACGEEGWRKGDGARLGRKDP